MYVNLGFGLPVLVSQFIPADREVVFESENGILDIGRVAEKDEEDLELIDARATPITLRPGASFFDSALSFVMIRGGYIDVSILGAYQVSESGDLANWSRSLAGPTGNIGGAMDLAAGAKQVWVMMEHSTGQGQPRILKQCTYPITAKKVVKLIFTDLAVMEVTPGGLSLREVAPGVTPAEVRASTDVRIRVNKDVKEIEF
jgi:3-oxoadipate CoA-transferase beta subunit